MYDDRTLMTYINIRTVISLRRSFFIPEISKSELDRVGFLNNRSIDLN